MTGGHTFARIVARRAATDRDRHDADRSTEPKTIREAVAIVAEARAIVDGAVKSRA
jgi:hypothetical protein